MASREVAAPRDASAVAELVASAAHAGRRVKAVGSGHSFSGIAVADDIRLELSLLTGLVDVDAPTRRVTLAAGTPLHAVPALLAPHGLAMANLGDIDRQTIAGAVSTGTHGTGARFGSISSGVVAATLVTGSGELLRVSETSHAELLPAIRVGLGALGILVDVTLQCVPAFALHAIERPEPLDDVLAELPERIARADHFEFYWFPHTRLAATKTNTRLPAEAELRPRSRASRVVDETLMEGGVFRAACAASRAVPAIVPVVNRIAARTFASAEVVDASHRVFATRRSTRFAEMEYAVPLERLPDAFSAVRALVERSGWRIEFPIEVRSAAADDAWMSTSAGRASGYIAVHRYHRADHAAYFSAVAAALREFGGRPHWGKVHGLSAADLRALYPRFDDFARVRERLDPAGVFANDYLDRVLGGVRGSGAGA